MEVNKYKIYFFRQIEPSTGGSYMNVTFEAPKGFEKILKDQLMRLEYNVVIIEVVREGKFYVKCEVIAS